MDGVRTDLVAIVRAGAAERAALVEAFVAGRAAAAIEAVKRFRNPERLPLFHALLRHADGHVVHRVLHALERFGDGTAVPEALARLAHAEPRLREKAAITGLVLWDRAGKAAPPDAAATVANRLATKGDPHVHACLEALALRIGKKLDVEAVSDEVGVTLPDGFVTKPFLEGMDTAKQVAPDATSKPVARTGGGSAAKLPVARR